MSVQRVTRYVYKGKEYKSLLDIQSKIHDTIGEEVLDVINRKVDIKHKDLFVLLEILTSPKVRETLVDCFSEFIEEEDWDDHGVPKTIVTNILDIK
jgi:hypothetical protein